MRSVTNAKKGSQYIVTDKKAKNKNKNRLLILASLKLDWQMSGHQGG